MTHAIVVDAIGGPDAMQWRPHDPGAPGPGDLRVRQTAAGLNFIDVYFRNGTYKAPAFPFVPGKEGAGVVTEVGSDVRGFSVGDRVAYSAASGTYAEEINVPASVAVHIPEGISDEVAAGIMLKGMTAEYLLRRTFPVGPGHTVLIQAAAGGVGLIAGQWAKHLGATVIGTAGSDEKVRLALEHGYDHVGHAAGTVGGRFGAEGAAAMAVLPSEPCRRPQRLAQGPRRVGRAARRSMLCAETWK